MDTEVDAIRFVWFPPGDFKRARELWPTFAKEWEGYDHTRYCRQLEMLLRQVSARFSGAVGLGIVTNADHYGAWCSARGLNPDIADSRMRYAIEVHPADELINWPPESQQACWCRSGRRYAECCGAIDYAERPDEEAVSDLLISWANLPWPDLVRAIPDHPEFFSDNIARSLDSLIAQNRNMGYVEIADALERFLAFITKCAEEGVEEALAHRLLETITDDWQSQTQMRKVVLEVTQTARSWTAGEALAFEAHVKAWETFIAELRAARRPSAEVRAASAGLGGAHIARYEETRSRSDLDNAIDIAVGNAREFPYEDLHARAKQLHELGVLWALRHHFTEDPEDADKSINAIQQALQESNLTWEPYDPLQLRFADLLMERYQLRGSDQDLDQAIAVYGEYANFIRTDAERRQEYAVVVHRRALALRERFNRHHYLSDVNEAVKLLEPIRKLQLDKEAKRSIATTLGGLLRLRYEILGRADDLNRAIRVNREALVSQDQVSELQATALNNLGVAMMTRYARLNQPRDVESAIRFFRRGVAASEADSPIRWERLHNLVSGLVAKYLWTRQSSDGEQALRALEGAGLATPATSPAAFRQSAWHAIIRSYMASQEMDAQLAEKAWRLGEHALGSLPQDDFERSRLVSGLVNAVLAYYDHGRSDEALERAIELSEFALRCPEAFWPYLPAQCADLARAVERRYAIYKDPLDLTRVRDLYALISTHSDKGGLQDRLLAACDWTQWAVRRGDEPEIAEAASAVRNVGSRLAAVWLDGDAGRHWWNNVLAAVSVARDAGKSGHIEDSQQAALEEACAIFNEQTRALTYRLLHPKRRHTNSTETARVNQALGQLRILDRSSLHQSVRVLKPSQTGALSGAWDELFNSITTIKYRDSILMRNLAKSLGIVE